MRYVDAVKFKIKSANKVMKKARLAGNEEMYINSETAKMFNQLLLDEMEDNNGQTTTKI